MPRELTIYEVRTCSTCRKLSALLAERGVQYTGVEYHEVGISQARLRELLAKADAAPRELLRTRDPLVGELGILDDAGEQAVSDDELIALMSEHPTLLQRPIVERGDRALLARPIERALELLD